MCKGKIHSGGSNRAADDRYEVDPPGDGFERKVFEDAAEHNKCWIA